MDKQWTVELRKPKKGEEFFRWNNSEKKINIYTAGYDFEIDEFPVICKKDTSKIDNEIRLSQDEYWSRGSGPHIPFDNEDGRFG